MDKNDLSDSIILSDYFSQNRDLQQESILQVREININMIILGNPF